MRYSEVRSLSRWAHATRPHASLEDFLANQPVNGLHVIQQNEEPPIDIHVRLFPGRPMVIFFNGNTPRDKVVELPAFSGMGILPDTSEVSRVCVSDPTLHLARDLCLSWYAGSKNQPLQRMMPRILRHIFMTAKPSKIIFAGGSGGGFASLYYASFFPESMAFVWNPQTDIRNYNAEHIIHYAQIAFQCGRNLKAARAALTAHVDPDLAARYGSARNHAIYLQNRSDGHTETHLRPFAEALGSEFSPENSHTVLRSNLHVIVDHWADGHVPPPKALIGRMLMGLLKERRSWSDAFAEGMPQRLYETARNASETPVDWEVFAYRFPKWRDAKWNSYNRQKARYQLLSSLLGTNLVGAEIGAYKGGFSEFLLPHCRKLYVVDRWHRGGAYWNSGIEHDSRLDSMIAIMTAYRDEIHNGLVEVVAEQSWTFLNSRPDDSLDFVYLEPTRNYHQALAEIRMAAQKIKPGGLLIGNAYDPDPKSSQHAVFRAVGDFKREASIDLELDADRQWALRIPGAAIDMLDQLPAKASTAADRE
jgi:hypothetical protein